MKNPSSYQQAYKDYDESFRNKVVKSKRNNLTLELEIFPQKNDIVRSYELYDRSMDIFGSASVPYEFFEQLCLLSYSALFLVKKDAQVVAFTLMLGNLSFFAASSEEGKKFHANNFLYDALYHYFENEKIFLGLASSPGLFAFKKKSGAIPVPAYCTRFDPLMSFSNFFKNKRFFGCCVRKLPKTFTLSYVLPY